MMYFALNDQGRVMGVADFPDEAAEFIDRVAGNGNTTWSATGQQLSVPDGTPTGWRIMKRAS